jgi:hypothetical protein
MPTDTNSLMGEVVNDPAAQEKDVEQLLVGFLSSLIAEQSAAFVAPTAAQAPKTEQK